MTTTTCGKYQWGLAHENEALSCCKKSLWDHHAAEDIKTASTELPGNTFRYLSCKTKGICPVWFLCRWICSASLHSVTALVCETMDISSLKSDYSALSGKGLTRTMAIAIRPIGLFAKVPMLKGTTLCSHKDQIWDLARSQVGQPSSPNRCELSPHDRSSFVTIDATPTLLDYVHRQGQEFTQSM